MRYLTWLLLFFVLASSAQAGPYWNSETRANIPDHGRIYVLHNNTHSVWAIETGSTAHFIEPGFTREIYIQPGISGIVRSPTGAAYNPSTWQSIGPKPWVMELFTSQSTNAPATFGIYALPAVELVNPYDQFALGISLGLGVAVSIAGLRHIRRAFQVSSE